MRLVPLPDFVFSMRAVGLTALCETRRARSLCSTYLEASLLFLRASMRLVPLLDGQRMTPVGLTVSCETSRARLHPSTCPVAPTPPTKASMPPERLRGNMSIPPVESLEFRRSGASCVTYWEGSRLSTRRRESSIPYLQASMRLERSREHTCPVFSLGRAALCETRRARSLCLTYPEGTISIR